MGAMKPKAIDDLFERVKSWPPGAQGDLAQAMMSIEADIERGAYGGSYVPTPEEAETLERRCKELDEGSVEPVGFAEISRVFSKYRP
jgi:hypothetical protein